MTKEIKKGRSFILLKEIEGMNYFLTTTKVRVVEVGYLQWYRRRRYQIVPPETVKRMAATTTFQASDDDGGRSSSHLLTAAMVVSCSEGKHG